MLEVSNQRPRLFLHARLARESSQEDERIPRDGQMRDNVMKRIVSQSDMLSVQKLAHVRRLPVGASWYQPAMP